MMDIVEKLRRYRPTYGWPEERSVIVEPTMNHVAADEIERLREALKEVSGYVARAEWFYMTEETKAVVGQVFGEVK